MLTEQRGGGGSNVYSRYVPKSRLATCVPDDVEPGTCISVVASLREEFASRFAGVRPHAADFKLFTAPFDIPMDSCRWCWWSLSAVMN